MALNYLKIATSTALRAAKTPIMQAVKAKTCFQEYALPAMQGQLRQASCPAISNSPARMPDCGLEFLVIRFYSYALIFVYGNGLVKF